MRTGDGQDDDMTLVEFLRARLDEDEQRALAASPGPWSSNAEVDEVTTVDGITVCDGFALSNNQLRATVRHIACHDPARVLREVDAKRQLIALFEVYDASARYPDSEGGIAIGLGTAVEFAALAYVDHPDYDEAWRPA